MIGRAYALKLSIQMDSACLIAADCLNTLDVRGIRGSRCRLTLLVDAKVSLAQQKQAHQPSRNCCGSLRRNGRRPRGGCIRVHAQHAGAVVQSLDVNMSCRLRAKPLEWFPLHSDAAATGCFVFVAAVLKESAHSWHDTQSSTAKF